jgi:uncharacterized protein (DUF305 family)
VTGSKTKVRYLTAILALAALIVAGVSTALAQGDGGQSGRTTGEDAMGAMMGDSQMGSMMDGSGMGSMMPMMGGGGGMGSMMGAGQMQPMGSFDENRPFDLQFIDQMIMHHQGALMSSEHMIADSERPELRELAQSIQESQSEQIEQMQEWRKEWYPDAERTFGMMDPTRMDEMMGDGMMEQMTGGSMQEMMGGDATDAMFLRMMIPHHQMAVDMSEEALERAEHPELKELARKIIDEQSAEIELMQGYLDEIDAADGN